MRKIFGTLMVFLMLLVGCQQEVPTITATNLTENEKELLKAVGFERYFAFDIELSQIDFEQLEYRVDYYKHGQFVEHLLHGSISGHLSKKDKQRKYY